MALVSSDGGSGQNLIPITDSKVSAIENQESDDGARPSFSQEQDERKPLIRARRQGDDITDDVSSVASNEEPPRRYGAVTRRRTTQEENETNSGVLGRILATLSMPSGSVMAFLLILVIGIVLTAAANLNTDGQGMQVEPKHVLVYVMVLMVVFIVWTSYAILLQKFQYSSQHNGALIPSHLLTGIGIFGTVCATTQMLSFVDFVKCRRHAEYLSVIYGIYPFFKSFFVYFQMYFFYKLSRDGIRDCKVPGGNFFIMLTLATNMCMWGVLFINDASNDPKMKDVQWLNHYYYGVNGYDPCAANGTSPDQLQHLHRIIVDFEPYNATFSMEYALLASGLLLHVWMTLKMPLSSQALRPERQHWTLWRVGFILGLLCIPLLFITFISEVTQGEASIAKTVLYILEGIFYIVLLAFSRYCTVLLKGSSGFVKCISRSMQLEVTLLGISFIGFPVLDICCTFAAVAEFVNFPILEVISYILTSVAELVAVSLQFLFIKKAYEHKLPEVASEKVRKSAGLIRQFSSFALVVNLGYWAAKTYQLRKPDNYDPTIAEKFFGSYAWFALSHLSYPLCIFFHFHLAICFANVIFYYSQFGPLHKAH